MDVAVVAQIDPRGNAARRRPARRRAAVKEAPRPAFLRAQSSNREGAPRQAFRRACLASSSRQLWSRLHTNRG